MFKAALVLIMNGAFMVWTLLRLSGEDTFIPATVLCVNAISFGIWLKVFQKRAKDENIR